MSDTTDLVESTRIDGSVLAAGADRSVGPRPWFDAPAGLVALVYLGAGWQLVLDAPAYFDGMTGG